MIGSIDRSFQVIFINVYLCVYVQRKVITFFLHISNNRIMCGILFVIIDGSDLDSNVRDELINYYSIFLNDVHINFYCLDI